MVFLYSFLLTGTMNLLAVLLIPDGLRMKSTMTTGWAASQCR